MCFNIPVCCCNARCQLQLSQPDAKQAAAACRRQPGPQVHSARTNPGVYACLLPQVANWVEPLLRGDVPAPRKGAAAAASEGRIIMVGGTGTNAEEQPVVLDEIVVFDMEDTNSLVCSVNPIMSGPRPAARTGATILEYAPGQLLLYGGFNTEDKPLNDAYLLDVDALTWRRVYNGHADLVGPQGMQASHCMTADRMLLAPSMYTFGSWRSCSETAIPTAAIHSLCMMY